MNASADTTSCNHYSAFAYAVLLGSILGVIWSLQPADLSRWNEYQAIRLAMGREEVISRVDSSDKSRSGCGAFNAESRESVCRFEDPWRGYVINFDPSTKQVNRKHFYFKRMPGIRIP